MDPFTRKNLDRTSRTTFYSELCSEVEALIDRFWFTNLANASATLASYLVDINWVGFYLAEGQELFLGPFQGKPACLRIPFARGVCGTAAFERRIVRVDDVAKFPGHIACDALSKSEIVLPMITADGRILGVLDVDSPLENRFDAEDEVGLKKVVDVIVRSTRWPAQFSN